MRVSRLLLIFSVLASAAARGDPWQHEFLLLPSVSTVGTFDRHAPETQIVDEVVQADMIFSLQKGPFKVFGEYLRSDHEGDLERFQLGWQLSNDTVVWIGRFHQPTSVWNHDHHHGQYLQTSITRPGIDEWEDLGGVLPQHFTGMLIESNKAVLGGWQLRTAYGAGIAPQINHQGMEPLDILSPDHDRHQAGYQARASLHPSDFTETGFGVLAAHDDMPGVGLTTPGLSPGELSSPALLGLDHVRLTLLGVFGTYAADTWKVQAVGYHANARLFYTTSSLDDHFMVAYLQAEKRFPANLTPFARWEESAHAAGSSYLRLFDRFARERQVVGLRWDFVRRQALTLQADETHTLNGRYADVRLQWSAAFF
jgi:hypothetical protein